jgi:beta-phosphoglucomutase
VAIKAVILDLDGVIVSTDECHYLAWKRLADEQGIPFDRQINHRLRGVSRMQSLEIILERSRREYASQEKQQMAERKNQWYRQMLSSLTPQDILPGAMEMLKDLKARGVKVAVGSSSKNSPLILQRIGLENFFDATVDGNEITHSKPHPEVFQKAAERLRVEPQNCLVVEDAAAGVESAINAGMKCLALGAAQGHPQAHLSAPNLTGATVDQMLAL